MAKMQNRLRDVRQARGLTQQALANQAGLTRQTVGAIEAGDYGPSLEVALRLARALGAPLDDIFSLASDREPDAALLPRSGATRVLSAMIGGREVLRDVGSLGAYRWPAAAADGVAEVDVDARVALRRFAAARADTVFLAGCDPALGLVAEHLQQRGLRAFWFTSGSGAALSQLRNQRTHFGAVHWTQGEDPPAVPDGVERLELSRWQMGFVVRHQETRFKEAQDLGLPGLRLANREQGAGARRLLDRLLAQVGVAASLVAGYGWELQGHWEVANAVAQGAADVAIASGAAAEAFSLDFLPLSAEMCEVWWEKGTVSADVVQRLGDTLLSSAFRRDLGAFGPFDTARTGAVPDLVQRGKG